MGRVAAWGWWTLVLGIPSIVVLALTVNLIVRAQLHEITTIISAQSGVLLDTGVYGLATAVLATALAWTMAHVQHCYRFPGRRVVHWLALVPLVMPSFTLAMALLVILGHNGLAARALDVDIEIYGLPGLVLAGTLARLPYAYLMVRLFYRTLDATLFLTAEHLGAGPWKALRVIAWPRLRMVLFTVFLLVFAETVADLANPVVIGGSHRVVASRLYEAVTGEGDLVSGAIYGALLLVPSLGYLLVSRRSAIRGWDSVISRSSGGWEKSPGVVGWWLVATSWVASGLIALLLGAVVTASFVTPDGIGIANYRALLEGAHLEALAWSVLLMVVVVPVSILLAIGGVLLVAPYRRWIAHAERLCRAVATIPPIMWGFGACVILIAARTQGVGSVGAQTALHFALIAAVLILRSLPTNALLLLNEASRLTPDLRGAAMSLGAKGRTLVRLVYMPRLRDPVRGAAVLSVARSVTATSSVVLLSDMLLPLMTARMLIDVGAAQFGTAAAMSVLVCGLVALGAILVWGRPADA
ncbi:MAG: ABC transporter permease subunit [Tessaracoccus sp.]